jgi:Uma2 family endonuclease
MNALLPTRLTIEEFLRWSMDQERGRYELEAGRIVEMQAENASHTRTKQRVYAALVTAIERAGLPFYAMPDGPTVRIASDRAYEPDALIAPLPEVPDDALEISNPIAVFEVLSPTPSSIRRDLSIKVEGYGRVATIEHYVIIDPMERQVLHYRRKGDVLVPPPAPTEGDLSLDPPGLEMPLEALLVPAATTS